MTGEKIMGRLEKKIAIVTDAAQGIGEGIAKSFLKKGVVLMD